MNKFKTKEIIEKEEKLKHQNEKFLQIKNRLNKIINSLISSSNSSQKNITSFKNINKQISEFSEQSEYVDKKPHYQKNLKKFENIFQINSNTFEKMSQEIENLIFLSTNLKKDIREAILTIEDFFIYKEKEIDQKLQEFNNAHNSNLFEEYKINYFDNIKKIVVNLDFFLEQVNTQVDFVMDKSMDIFKEHFKNVYAEWENNACLNIESGIKEKDLVLC